MGCNTSLKHHFFVLPFEFLFPENFGAFSDERGGRFHQDISQMENMYSGKWSPNMLGDFCWSLIWQTSTGEYESKEGEVVYNDDSFL
jgi:hypothetical protein